MRTTTVVCASVAVSAAAGLLVARLQRSKRKKKVVITGACGNLGTKLGTFLTLKGHWEVVGIEHPDYLKPRPYRVVSGDVATVGPWEVALENVDVVVHFSAVNPYQNASWAESALSMSHAFNIFLLAQRYGAKRLVMASSNHVYGGYKDDFDHGLIRPSDPPRCGTFPLNEHDLKKSGDAVAYAAAKLAAEQLLKTLSSLSKSLECLVLRVGWCQPGDNSPLTISSAGLPEQFARKVGETKISTESTDDIWFKEMWLSNDDFLALFCAALEAPLQSPFSTVNAMSHNTGARWSLQETEAILGVTPKDDFHKVLRLHQQQQQQR